MNRSAAVLLLLVLAFYSVGCGGEQYETERIAPATVAVTSGSTLLDSSTALSITDNTDVGSDADSTDRIVFERLMKSAVDSRLNEQHLGQIVQEVGSEFLGAEYVAGLLDESDRETLVISLTKFDCVLYVEAVLAASQGVVSGDLTFGGYADRLQKLRYRDGAIDGYCSRLHYFTDWINENEK
ncbi:MAG: DUF1460 domain-containing protein, partial [Rhodothermales bacterium]|nr:DUF1460 domain-containing protein [Rhodothermales bacterium]